jgi:hypothetical protein
MARRNRVIAGVIAGSLAIASSALAAGVAGTVKFEGKPPERRPLQMNADPKCVEINGGKTVLAEELMVDGAGGLANVFVYVVNPPAAAPASQGAPAKPVELDQEGCLYRPRVQGILVDQTLEISNGDDVLHNVRALAEKNRPFNLGQPAGTAPRVKTFKIAEPALKFKCDVHPWMAAYLFVMDHPYFGVSGADGSYALPRLPPGTYSLVAWHEKLGEKKTTVEVGADGSGTANFTFDAASAPAPGGR